MIEAAGDVSVGRTGSPSEPARDDSDADRPAANRTAIYYAGDSAWFDGFAEVGRRFPQLDLALIPIAGYEPAWFMENNHLNPEQAGQAFLDCGAHRLVPMHWGTFQLTDEPLSNPIERLRRWWTTADIADRRQLIVPAVGETIVLDHAPTPRFTDDRGQLAVASVGSVAGVSDPGGRASSE